MSNQAVTHKLVIVESPAKARTIEGYLGRGYVVESSIGHIRDLPQSAADIPAKLKGEPWARLGVDVDNDFEPVYVVSRDKKSHMTKLKGLLKDADELYLATDEDREGEAIAWHLLDELKPEGARCTGWSSTRSPRRRSHAAVENPREIDMDLVEAQEARRILDRLYGYEVSPVLWRKVMSGLSAGRVQSVATRLVVDRERERMAFRVASYWDLEGTFDAGEKHEQRMFPAKLHSVDDTRVARGSDFGQDGELEVAGEGRPPRPSRVPRRWPARCTTPTSPSARWSPSPTRRRPYAPFRTTTLQQEASRKLGFSASSTMSVAQRLYENGFITYMRTDSTTLSGTAITAARSQARELYGAEYIPDAPRTYASKVKNAQEAHEAIRPAGDSFRTPAQTGLTGDQFRLYELIWMRTIASQMKDAVGNSVTIRLGGAASTGEDVVFSASGRVITFHGFLKAYVEGSDDDKATDDQETRLPNVSEGDAVSAANIRAEGHSTKPPARYTEATLIKELEEREIGRPSTYASIIGTILNRGYVYKKGTALVPAWLAFSVIRLLEEHFTRLVSYEFTARHGGRARRHRRRAPRPQHRARRSSTSAAARSRASRSWSPSSATSTPRSWRPSRSVIPRAGIALRVGKYGPYLEGPGDDGTPAAKKANVPDDLPPDELTLAKAKELLANPAGEEIPLGTHPETGLEVVAKNGRYGPYVTELLPEDAPKKARPRTGSLFKDMSLDTIDLEQARAAAVAAAGGRRGRRGRRDHRAERALRPLPEEGHRLALAGDRGAALRHHPRRRRSRSTPSPSSAAGLPRRPRSRSSATTRSPAQPVVVKAGRFGEYVTDGEYNATLRKDDSVEAITLERAAELLAERRAKGPAKKAAKRGAKKTRQEDREDAKKTTKKAAAKKS